MAKPWLKHVKALLSHQLSCWNHQGTLATLLAGADQAGRVVGGPIWRRRVMVLGGGWRWLGRPTNLRGKCEHMSKNRGSYEYIIINMYSYWKRIFNFTLNTYQIYSKIWDHIHMKKNYQGILFTVHIIKITITNHVKRQRRQWPLKTLISSKLASEPSPLFSPSTSHVVMAFT